MKSNLIWLAFSGLLLGLGLVSGYFISQMYGLKGELLSPIFSRPPTKDTHLNKYAITQLRQLVWTESKINLTHVLKTQSNFTSYQFSYDTVAGRMTGLMNIPARLTDPTNPRVIILIRGYVPLEIYEPGVGSRAAGEALAGAGYITLAPDFLGYGESQPEPSDVLEARFIKPAQMMHLVRLIEEKGIPLPTANQLSDAPAMKTSRIGIWAHSNGGQIALTALEGLSQSIPTTLWAPVTAPFPYSILFFTDEELDEGKAGRVNVAIFEKNYDSFQFSLTQHLNLLTGPLQLHQGTADEAVPVVWNREFRDKILAENKSRQISPSPDNLSTPIELNYFEYPAADHNMKPGWDEAMARDLVFFSQNIK